MQPVFNTLLLHHLVLPFADLAIWISVVFSEFPGDFIDIPPLLLLRMDYHFEHLWQQGFPHVLKFFQVLLHVVEILLSGLFRLKDFIKLVNGFLCPLILLDTIGSYFSQLPHSLLCRWLTGCVLFFLFNWYAQLFGCRHMCASTRVYLL